MNTRIFLFAWLKNLKTGTYNVCYPPQLVEHIKSYLYQYAKLCADAGQNFNPDSGLWPIKLVDDGQKLEVFHHNPPENELKPLKTAQTRIFFEAVKINYQWELQGPQNRLFTAIGQWYLLDMNQGDYLRQLISKAGLEYTVKMKRRKGAAAHLWCVATKTQSMRDFIKTSMAAKNSFEIIVAGENINTIRNFLSQFAKQYGIDYKTETTGGIMKVGIQPQIPNYITDLYRILQTKTRIDIVAANAIIDKIKSDCDDLAIHANISQMH